MHEANETPILEYRRLRLRHPHSPFSLIVTLLRLAFAAASVVGFAYAIICWKVFESYSRGPEGGDVMRVAVDGVWRGAIAAVVFAVALLVTFVPWRRAAL